MGKFDIHRVVMTIDLWGPLDYCVEQCLIEMDKGFVVVKQESFVVWPYLWKRKWHIVMECELRNHDKITQWEGCLNNETVEAFLNGMRTVSDEAKLQRAIKSEDYELAAQLRDKLKLKN